MEVIELPSKNEKSVRVRFMGIVYRRYPQAKGFSDQNYFRAGHADKLKGRSYVHRDLWKAHHGDIPEGMEVDHKDGNPLNNTIGNLQLLTNELHHAKHSEEQAERMREYMANMPEDQRKDMLDKAADWHRSEDGRDWHKEHAKKLAASRPDVDLKCEQCGKNFTVIALLSTTARFCSNNCKATNRRASKVDDIDRVCPICIGTFRVNKYSKSKTCSRACGRKSAASVFADRRGST